MSGGIQVIKLRLKDKHASELKRQARAVNFVWNFCNETQQKAVKSGRKWLNKYDLQKLTAGSSKIINLHGHTIQQACHGYERNRKAQKKAWLKWRSSKRSLGWVPFNTACVKPTENGYKFREVLYETMHDRDLPLGTVIRAGSFNEDSRGRWYINLAVNIHPVARDPLFHAVG